MMMRGIQHDDAAHSTIIMKILPLLLLAAAPLAAHVGSPDVFFEGQAGPYQLLVTIRPPQVVPGVAEIEIRSLAADVTQIHIVPLRLLAAQQFAPVPDLARPSKDDPQFYTGSLWLMSTGSWKVRVDVDGARGKGTLSVPVPALSTRVLGMQKAVGAILIPLGLLLVFGLVAVVGASVREAQLAPGAQPDRARIRTARWAMLATAAILGVVLWGGANWWNSAAGDYASYVYKPLRVNPSVENGNQLVLQLDDPGWLNRRTDDLLPDHNHLMHLYVIHLPAMDRVWHLHPERGANDVFRQALPSMDAGRYALFGDIVHANGIGETVTAQLDLPEIHGVPLTGDDAGSASLGVKANYNPVVSELPDGYRMIWEGGGGTIHSRRPYLFRFRLQDAAGQRARRHATVYGNGRTRGVRVHGSNRLRARASIGLGPDGGARPGARPWAGTRIGAAGQSPRGTHDDGPRTARRGVLSVRVSQTRHVPHLRADEAGRAGAHRRLYHESRGLIS